MAIATTTAALIGAGIAAGGTYAGARAAAGAQKEGFAAEERARQEALAFERERQERAWQAYNQQWEAWNSQRQQLLNQLSGGRGIGPAMAGKYDAARAAAASGPVQNALGGKSMEGETLGAMLEGSEAAMPGAEQEMMQRDLVPGAFDWRTYGVR